MRIQEKNTVSITNTIIETNHSGERYYNYLEEIIKNTIKESIAMETVN